MAQTCEAFNFNHEIPFTIFKYSKPRLRFVFASVKNIIGQNTSWLKKMPHMGGANNFLCCREFFKFTK